MHKSRFIHFKNLKKLFLIKKIKNSCSFGYFMINLFRNTEFKIFFILDETGMRKNIDSYKSLFDLEMNRIYSLSFSGLNF